MDRTPTPDGVGGFSNDGIVAISGNLSGQTNRLCINYNANTSAGGSGRDGYQLEQFESTTFQIQGIGAGNTVAAVEGFVQGGGGAGNTSGSADVQAALAGFYTVNYTNFTCATP